MNRLGTHSTAYACLALFVAITFALAALAFTGCAAFRARVATATASAIAPADPATPAKVEEAALPIPAGSTVEVRRETITPAPTPDEPSPTPHSIETLTITPAADTRLTLARAESGTQRAPDARAALRREDNKARAPLLMAALSAAGLAALAVFLRYPTPAILCGIGSVVFFLAWQVASLPQWVWITGGGAIAIAAGLYFGHERAARAASTAEKPA